MAEGVDMGVILTAAAELLGRLEPLARAALGWGVPAGVALCMAGVAGLTLAERFRRPSAALGMAAVGALAAVTAGAGLFARLGAPPPLAAGVCALGGLVAGAIAPRAFPVAAGALLGVIVGLRVPLAGRALLGAGAGALLFGVVALALARALTAITWSAAGAVAVILGLLALAGPRPLAAELAVRPAALVGAALVLAIAGAAFQLGRERDPEPRRGALQA